MSEQIKHRDFKILHLTSSGSKVMIQLMMFLVVGVMPILFPERIQVDNRNTVFFIVSLALVTSVSFEVVREYLVKKGKDTNLLLNIQLLTSVILLTPFLHFFGRINGPFFVLYLLTIMESFLNLNYIFSYLIVGIMILSTSVEFIWLISKGEIILGFIPVVGFVVRILSIIFISAYGFVLARKTVSEEKARDQIQEYAKKIEETKNKLQELNKKLEELDKQKDEFVSMAAHELRSPLTAIKGYVSMVIEGDTGDIPEKARQYLADSMAVTDRLVRLVNNMLNVSRIEEGRIVYQIEETSLIHAVQEVFNSSRVEAERKELEFKVSIPNGLSDTIKVDPDRIREVVGNLVSNAIKFTEKGKVSLLMTNPKPDIVKVEVVDTGPGISKEEQTKLFQKFYRVEATAGKTFGTGLGLYITRLLVEKFGGKMGLISDLDKGSNFWFELPVAKKV